MRKSLTMASVAVLATSLAACSSTGGRKAVEEAQAQALVPPAAVARPEPDPAGGRRRQRLARGCMLLR